MTVSPQRRRDIIDAIRSGTVPQRGLDLLAIGMDRFVPVIDEELASVRQGNGQLKAVRGEYGSGKTFFARWVEERAKRAGFAVSEVQISETETPLHRLETVYRRLMERLSTPDQEQGAFRSVVDAWFYALEEDLLASGDARPNHPEELLTKTDELMEKRLGQISQLAPTFSAALRGYRAASTAGDAATAEALLAWVSGQPNVAAAAKRSAGIKGEVDHFGALCFLEGLLTMLRDAGFSGLVFVLDEVETLQRVRGDVREKALNALRQLIDELHSGRFGGLYLLITGTPAFFEGPQGVQKLPPLRSVFTSISGRTPVSIIRGHRKFVCGISICRAYWKSAARCATCSLPEATRAPAYSDSRATPTLNSWHARWPADWAGRLGWRRASFLRNWSPTSWIASSCSPILIRGSITPSPFRTPI